jgi:hypothetical protein
MLFQTDARNFAKMHFQRTSGSARAATSASIFGTAH